MTILEMPPRARPLTAAAVSLADGVNSKELVRQLRRHEAWQQDATGYVSEIGEIHYVVNRAASALSEAILYCATKSAEGQLVPVDAPESLVSPAVAAIAIAELEKLRSPVGGQAQLVHQAFVNLEVPGEFFLVDASTDENPDAGWWVRSVLETKINDPGEPVQIKGIGEVPYDAVSRVWRPHPMRFEAADSGMRPILGACELVILIDRHFRAAMKSRLFAGLLLMPNSFREGPPDTSQKGDPHADPVVQGILDALNEGIGEEGTASAVTPNSIYGATDDIEAVRLLEFGQRIDPNTLKLRDSSIARIVQGLEYPPEIVTGTGDVSHWGAWFIGDSFVDHVRPKGDFLADALTTVFLRPGLEAQGVSVEDAATIQLAFDYTPLKRKPNVVETATLAHDRLVISDESFRRDLGYDDDDAPEPEEVAERLLRKQQARGAQPGVNTGPPNEGPEAVAASALPTDLGGKLSRLDFELIERLFGATVAAMRRASERAGNRAKSRVAAAHREAVRSVPAQDVCAQLGPTLLAAAGLTEDELLDGGVDSLEKDYRRWIEESALAALTLTGAKLSGDALTAWRHRLAENIDRSWEWFRDSLKESLTTRLAQGGDPVESEIRALIRQAIASAGGAVELGAGVGVKVPVSAVQGIGTGPITLEQLALVDKEVAGWQWVHDSPEHPFPPHEALDGAEAATPEEFSVAFDGWPGDHAGCRCTLVPLIRRAND